MTERTRCLLLFATALLLCYLHLRMVDIPGMAMTLREHEQIMTHTIAAPWRERILPYAVADTLGRLFVVPGMGIWTVHALMNCLLLAAFLWLTYRFLARFGSHDAALVLTVFAALTFNVTLFFVPRSIPDSWVLAVMFVVAFHLLYLLFETSRFSTRRLLVAFGALLAVGMTNRIDTIVLVGAFAALAWRCNRRLLAVVPVYTALCLGVFFAVQGVTGAGVRTLTIAVIQDINRLTFFDAMISLTFFLSALWLLVFKRLRRTPDFIRWCMIGLLPYMGLLVVYGVWRETRLLVPVLPLLLAIVLSTERPTFSRS